MALSAVEKTKQNKDRQVKKHEKRKNTSENDKTKGRTTPKDKHSKPFLHPHHPQPINYLLPTYLHPFRPLPATPTTARYTRSYHPSSTNTARYSHSSRPSPTSTARSPHIISQQNRRHHSNTRTTHSLSQHQQRHTTHTHTQQNHQDTSTQPQAKKRRREDS